MGKGTETGKNGSSKIGKFFRKNFPVMILVLLSVGAVVVNYYDKKNSQLINVTVDPKLAATSATSAEQTQKIEIAVYNPETKLIENSEVSIPKQLNVIEGDFVNEIIKKSPYVTKEMKFQSAYNLMIEDKNTIIIKLNAQFSGLKANRELFDGFSQAIIQTITKNFPNVQSVMIQLDGETAAQ
ncbi:chemotaxis protein [Leptotrichia sp. OH3620_COT-345]|uniref:GerMN domain-containing protein n=1 Tax=Leptotrichia sp. OH3620_COT-345 TaxID=2491048 RepID=UPI000F651AA5|nr:GerMN domain-containing protein [Leptotrichia sp. OH3620_COT-345]RRD39918.1 chemotaxis protein [Leptotrichia sp. OH3620_COT-345]